MKKLCVLLAMSTFIGCATTAAAQTPQLPNVLWIYREDAKPARGTAHHRVEQRFAQHWGKAKVQPYLGLEALSGNANEVMFLSGYDSLAALEKDFEIFAKAASGPDFEALEREEAELINGVRSAVAVLRPDLSYRADKMVASVQHGRYMTVETFRVRLGHDAEFAAGAKVFQNAFEKMKRETPYAMYQIVMGAPEGTYLLFVANASLREIDDDLANQKALFDAMGPEANDLMKRTGDVFLTMESNVYALSPAISNVSKEFAAADPAFWAPRPLPKRSPAPKKEGAKPANGGESH